MFLLKALGMLITIVHQTFLLKSLGAPSALPRLDWGTSLSVNFSKSLLVLMKVIKHTLEIGQPVKWLVLAKHDIHLQKNETRPMSLIPFKNQFKVDPSP